MSEHDPIDWDELDAETQHDLVSLAEKLDEESGQSGGRTASRREFLGAITAAGLGGSLLSQGADRAFEDFVNPASAGTQSVAQFGESGEPFDFVAEDIYGPGGKGSGDTVNFESVSTADLNNIKFVSDEQELKSAAGSHTHIALASDFVWSGGALSKDIGSTDFHLLGRGKLIRRGDTQDDILIELTTTGDVSVQNLKVDGNHQSFSNSEYNELWIKDAERAVFDNVTVINNVGWAFRVANCSHVRSNNCEVQSNSGDSDCLHVVDPDTLVVSGATFSGGDDACVVEVNTDTDGIHINGYFKVVGPSGAPVRIYGDASSAATADNINIIGTIGGSPNRGVYINDLNDNLTVNLLNINVSEKGSSGPGVLIGTGGGTVDISGVYENPIVVRDFDNVAVDASVRSDVRPLIIENAKGGKVSGTYKATVNDPAILVKGCENISVDAQAGGISGQNAYAGVWFQNTVRSKASGAIQNADTGVLDSNGSDYNLVDSVVFDSVNTKTDLNTNSQVGDVI